MASGVTIVIVIAIAVCVPGVPAYVIARRSGLRNPWVGFIPILGLWIVLCEATGQSGWLALFVFLPYLGALVLSIWAAFQVPARHGRSRWWALALLVPGPNLVGYWAYAFTLPRLTVQEAIF